MTLSLVQKLQAFGISVGAACIQALPYRAIRFVSDPLGLLVYYCDRRGRAVAAANLDAVFRGALTPERKTAIAKASYQTFARTILELFWSPRWTKKNLAQAGTVEGLHQAFHRDDEKPVIYLCLHSSNFELLSHAMALHAEPGIVVAQNFKNPALGQFFDRLRSATGHEIIPQERAMIRMFRHLKRGGSFCMLVDMNLDPRESSVIIDQFGGLKTCVTQMHAALALRTGARIIPAECHNEPDGTYRMIFHKPLEYSPDATEAEVAQLCWDVLEPFIHRQPEAWLWSYKHWRFKPSGGDTSRYPFYANSAKRFDKLAASQEVSA